MFLKKMKKINTIPKNYKYIYLSILGPDQASEQASEYSKSIDELQFLKFDSTPFAIVFEGARIDRSIVRTRVVILCSLVFRLFFWQIKHGGFVWERKQASKQSQGSLQPALPPNKQVFFSSPSQAIAGKAKQGRQKTRWDNDFCVFLPRSSQFVI